MFKSLKKILLGHRNFFKPVAVIQPAKKKKLVAKKSNIVVKSKQLKQVFKNPVKKKITIPRPVSNEIVPIIYPYKIGSEASKLLSTSLKTKQVFENGGYVYHPNHLIINYGNKRRPNWAHGKKINILNHWDSIVSSSNKLTALNAFSQNGVQTVEFTEDKAQAIEWANAGKTVICRTILNGYGGHGIVIAKSPKEIVDAPLYCVYKKNKGEYRIIVVNGIVIDFMQKKRKNDFEETTGKEVNGMIRNHDNGWIFARNDVTPPKAVLDEAVKAVQALGLNFAGVDVIYNLKENKAYVLECNTAMGLQAEGTTLKRLTEAFRAICQKQPPKSII